MTRAKRRQRAAFSRARRAWSAPVELVELGASFFEQEFITHPGILFEIYQVEIGGLSALAKLIVEINAIGVVNGGASGRASASARRRRRVAPTPAARRSPVSA